MFKQLLVCNEFWRSHGESASFGLRSTNQKILCLLFLNLLNTQLQHLFKRTLFRPHSIVSIAAALVVVLCQCLVPWWSRVPDRCFCRIQSLTLRWDQKNEKRDFLANTIRKVFKFSLSQNSKLFNADLSPMNFKPRAQFRQKNILRPSNSECSLKKVRCWFLAVVICD